jgi:hypothetical protein
LPGVPEADPANRDSVYWFGVPFASFLSPLAMFPPSALPPRRKSRFEPNPATEGIFREPINIRIEDGPENR